MFFRLLIITLLSSLVTTAIAGRYVLLEKDLRYMNAALMFDLYLHVMMGTFITTFSSLCAFL